jgi:hypothetical protein
VLLFQDEIYYVRKDRRGCVRGATSSEESSRVSTFCQLQVGVKFLNFFIMKGRQKELYIFLSYLLLKDHGAVLN